MFEMGQTFAIHSIEKLSRGEFNHMVDIAQLFVDSNQDRDGVVVRDTDFYGGKFTQAIEVFPSPSFFNGKLKKDMKNFRLTRLDWSVDTYVDSIRFTMTGGEVSPKFGGKAFTNCCEFESPIKKIVVRYRERGIVSLDLYSDSENLTIEGSGEAKHTDTVDVLEGESLIQFKVRVK